MGGTGESADVVIVGAGFAGAATAYHLVTRGLRDILILEREATPGFHASGRNAALAFQVLAEPAEARLAVEGTRFIAHPPDGFRTTPLLRRTGSLLVADVPGAPDLQQAHADAERLGLACELVTPADARAHVPALAHAPFTAAFWNPHDGVVDIAALLRGYLDSARRGGARIAYDRRVTGVRVASGRVDGIDTDRGPVRTRRLVNAAGAWAGEIGTLAGVGARTLEPRRRHMYRVNAAVATVSDGPFVWHHDLDVYFRPDGDTLLMSPCDATPHPPRDPAIDAAMQQRFVDKAARAFPALMPLQIASVWACLRTFAGDERFVIGPDPELDGLIWVAALGGHGMTTSAAVGRLGAAAVLGERCEELQPFTPARLAK